MRQLGSRKSIRTGLLAAGMVLVLLGLGRPIAAVGVSGAPGDELWTTRFDVAGGIESFGDAALSPDGKTVFLVGYTYPQTGDANIATVAYDALTGAELWRQIYDGPSGRTDLASSLAISPDGSTLYVAGSSEGDSFTFDYLTLALDTRDGSLRWEARYDGIGHRDDLSDDLTIAPDGSMVYVTGGSDGDGTYVDMATVAYDARTGQQVWVRRYTEPCISCADSGTAVALSPDGSTLFVAGYTNRITFDYYTVAYDANDGTERWATPHGWKYRDDTAKFVEPSPDGSRVYVSGNSNGDFDNGMTVAYDATTGIPIWHRWYTDHKYYWGVTPLKLVVHPDGSTVYLTGTFKTEIDSIVSNAGTVAYAADTGETLWRAKVDGVSGSGLALTPDGSTVLTAGADTSGHLIPIVGRLWVAFWLYEQVTGRYGMEGPFEVTLAFRQTKGALLGRLAAGWKDSTAGSRTRPQRAHIRACSSGERFLHGQPSLDRAISHSPSEVWSRTRGNHGSPSPNPSRPTDRRGVRRQPVRVIARSSGQGANPKDLLQGGQTLAQVGRLHQPQAHRGDLSQGPGLLHSPGLRIVRGKLHGLGQDGLDVGGQTDPLAGRDVGDRGPVRRPLQAASVPVVAAPGLGVTKGHRTLPSCGPWGPGPWCGPSSLPPSGIG